MHLDGVYNMNTTKNIEILPPPSSALSPEKGKVLPFYFKLIPWAFASLGRLFPGLAGKAAYQLFSTPLSRAVHKVSDEIIESARHFEVPYGGVVLQCYEWGSGSNTVLLVHGWESRGTALRTFVPGLVEAGCRVVAFDGPAHGDSGGRHVNLPEFAGALLAVVQQIGGVDSIISHSFGGAASAFALAYLNHSIQIENLVLIAVPASNQKVVSNYENRIHLPASARKAFHQRLLKKMKGLSLADSNLANALVKAKVQRVLVVHDKFDASVPYKSAESVFEKCDHASMLVTQGYGHYKLMKHPDVIGRVVAFATGKEATEG